MSAPSKFCSSGRAGQCAHTDEVSSIPEIDDFDHPPASSSADDPTPTEVALAGHNGDRATAEAGLRAADPGVRALALNALRRISDAEWTGEGVAADGPTDNEFVAHLVAALDDAEPAVRRRAAELAARVRGGAELEPPLRNALGDDDVIAEVAAYSLGELGSEGGIELDPATLAALEDQVRHHADALCREAAVAALGALHTGLDTILHACGDKATVRRRAVLALAPFEGPAVDAALQRALTDRDWQVRQAAEDLLGVGAPEAAEPDGGTDHTD